MNTDYKLTPKDFVPIVGFNKYCLRTADCPYEPSRNRVLFLASYNAALTGVLLFNREIAHGLEKLVELLK